MIHQAILIAVALAYSAAMLAAGRRLPRPASIAAYTTATAVLFSVPLFPEQTVQRVDHVLHIAGAGRLLVHGAFMTAITGLFLTVVLATHRWGWRPRLAVGGAGVLMGLFLMCWLTVQALHLPDMTAVFYGHGASPLGSAHLWVRRPCPPSGQALVLEREVLEGLSEFPTGPPTMRTNRSQDR